MERRSTKGASLWCVAALLLWLPWACEPSRTVMPSAACDPEKSARIKSAPLWSETLGQSKQQALGCLQVLWSEKVQTALVAITLSGRVYGYDPDTQNERADVSLSLPSAARDVAHQYQLFVFGRSALQTPSALTTLCAQKMADPFYVCDRSSQKECWFAFRFQTLPAGSLRKASACVLIEPAPQSGTETKLGEPLLEAPKEPLLEQREPTQSPEEPQPPTEPQSEPITGRPESVQDASEPPTPPDQVAKDQTPDTGPPASNFTKYSCPAGTQAPCVITLIGPKERRTGPANYPWFQVLRSVTFGPNGHTYVADFAGHKIYKLEDNNGTITVSVFAGSGVPGSQTGKAEVARFDQPYGLAFDDKGNLYVSDTRNRRICQIDPGGNVTMLTGGSIGYADGTLSQARFGYPTGLVFDGQGRLYVADSSYHTIRRIDLNAKVVSTVAGTKSSTGFLDGQGTAATLNRPEDLAMGPSGLLYINDTRNYAVRTYNPVTQAVTTLVGSGQRGTTDGALAQAQLDSPRGLALDGLEQLYVVEWIGSKIRKVTQGTAGAVSTFLAGGFTSGAGLAWRNNTLTLTASHFVHLIDAQGVLTQLAGESPTSRLGTPGETRLSGARSITLSPQGDLYIGAGGQILRYDRATDRVVASGPRSGSAHCMRFDGKGNLYFCGISTIKKIDQNGNISTVAGSTAGWQDGPLTQAKFWAPQDLVFDPKGNLYVADLGNHRIRCIDLAQGTVSTVAGDGTAASTDGSGTQAQLNEPGALAIDAKGVLYISTRRGDRIRQYNPANQQLSTLLATSLDGPRGLALASADTLIISDDRNGKLRSLNINTKQLTTLAGATSQQGFHDGPALEAIFHTPGHIAIDPHGQIYIIDELGGRVRLYIPK